jgi:hypothetical protein
VAWFIPRLGVVRLDHLHGILVDEVRCDPVFFYSAQNWQREATGPFVTATRAWQTAVDGVMA